MRQLNVVTAALLLFPLVLDAMDAPRVQDSIVRKATLQPRATCGSSLACSVVGAIALPDCRIDDRLQRVTARATLRLIGTIYYFRGTFRSVREKPHDATVVDQATAIDHEYAYHITPAVNAVEALLASFETAPFATLSECISSGSELAKTVTAAFQKALAETQVREKEGVPETGGRIARTGSRSSATSALLSTSSSRPRSQPASEWPPSWSRHSPPDK